MKRLLDIGLSVVLLAVFSPLVIMTAVLIKLNLGSPVLFKQERPGKEGKPFKLLKFRSMTDATDQAGRLLPDHQRLNRLGKFLRSTSLDELPSLINVIKGDMSLVGPRPLLMEYLPLYNEDQKKRHEVKPGITGWAQVNGRNSISWKEKFELDVWYVENRSFWLDVKILFLTMINVFRREGIRAKGHETMPKFEGDS